MKIFRHLPIVLIFFLVVPSISLGSNIPKVAVWNIEPRAVSNFYAKELTSILVSELTKLGKYEIYSQENIQTVTKWTEERMKLGTTDTQTLTMLGEMDISKLISGSVSKIGDIYSISINIFDVKQAKIENSISETCSTESELIDLTKKVVRRLSGMIIIIGDKIPDRCDAPVWNVGDKWIYRMSDGTITKEEVVSEEKDLYFLMGVNLLGYNRKTGNVNFLINAKGKKEEFRSGLSKLFNFPLYVGKTWKIDYRGSHPRFRGGAAYYMVEYRIEKIENVFTQAGSFQAFKITIYHNIPGHLKTAYGMAANSGELIWWYSPQVKHLIKRQVKGSPNYWIGTDWEQDSELFTYELK